MHGQFVLVADGFEKLWRWLSRDTCAQDLCERMLSHPCAALMPIGFMLTVTL